MASKVQLTEEEAALYDRQLRLWGSSYQEKLLNARLLVVGFRGLGAEILKNDVLAGVGAITMLDSEDVAEQDLGSNYFLREEDVGLKVSLSLLSSFSPSSRLLQ